jgi:hypothetical protein
MNEPLRWLHLSDFHIGKDDYAERKIFGRIHEHVERVVKEGFSPDFIFVTGDVADKAKLGQYSVFNDEFLAPLYEIVGYELIEKTYIVPGNHDVDRSVLPAFDRTLIASPSSRFFDAIAEGARLRNQQLAPRFKEFTNNISTKVPKEWIESEAGTFVDAVNIKGHDVGIVGINTAWLSKDEHDRHKLTPGIHLLEDALKSLPGCQAYIVLGHHPIDWCLDDETETFRRILGQYNALYLHGHLHKTRSMPEDGAARGFLTIQCGAAFQIRDRVKEPWVNGLLWGELDLEKRQVRLQPRHWNPDNGDWPLTTGSLPEERRQVGSDWYSFPLPSIPAPARAPQQSPQWSTPEGWQVVEGAFLSQRRRDLDEEGAVRYFDGGTPDWKIALSPAIPRRNIVKILTDRIKAAPENGQLQVTVLIGAGGEGKSTAFLQTIVDLVESERSWSALWHFDEKKPFPPEKALLLPAGERPWLIATDDADFIVDNLYAVAQGIHSAGRSDIHFLLACRDTDWLAAKGSFKSWKSVADYREIPLAGLEPADAEAIVRSWRRFGEKGMGRLSAKDEQEAIRLLVEAAERESATGEGAFFGAMLDVRIGDELKEHLKALLSRLDERKAPGGTLLSAFAFIAAMHAEGLDFLSRPVLAKVIGCDLRDLKPRVLAPLGREAAATTAGEFVFTRHRSIARAAVELLSTFFSYDIDQLYVDLAAAAVTSAEYVPQLAEWRFKLSEHFQNTSRMALAIRIAEEICEREAGNIFDLTHLAKLYRDAGRPELAVKSFREFSGGVRQDRGFYYEWGTVEGSAGAQPLSVWLDAFSLADQAAGTSPDNERAKLSLAGLGVAFGELYDQYHDRAFIEGRMAVAVLGLTLRLDATTKSYFERHKAESRAEGVEDMDWPAAIEKFKVVVESAWSLCGERNEFGQKISPPADMTFEGLRRLVENAAGRR